MSNGSTSREERALLRRQISRADEVSLNLLECRVGGTRHRWARVKPVMVFDVGVTLAYQCDQCLTLKHTCVSPKYGERLHRPVYTYPAGYRVKADRDERAMSPAAVRASLVKRVNLDSLPDAKPVPGPSEE